MRVTAAPAADPNSDDPKSVVVEVEPYRRWFFVTLDAIKADPQLATWDLVRLPRLSVVPVSAEQWRRLEDLCRRAGQRSDDGGGKNL